jgi:hypothetical protein
MERFYPWCVDLGSVMVTTKAVEAANIPFSTSYARTPHGEHFGRDRPLKRRSQKFAILQMSIRTPSGYTTNADGNFFHTLASHPKISAKVLRRLLLYKSVKKTRF